MTVKAGVPIIEGVYVAASIAAIYTVPSSLARTRVDNIAFTNTTAGALTLTVQIIESGGSVDPSNIMIDTLSIGSNETIEPSSLLQGLNTGDTIQAQASAGSSISVRATGTTFST